MHGDHCICTCCVGYTAAQIAANQGHGNISLFLSSVASEQVAASPDDYKDCYYVKEGTTWQRMRGSVQPLASIDEYMKRADEGIGSPGTRVPPTLKTFRILAVLYIISSTCYLVWRVLRSLNPGYYYFYSMPFWLVEAVGWTLGLCFVYSLFNQIERPGRDIAAMLEPEEYPQTDIFIVRYTEPVEILEATVVAALNSDFPGEKLTVYVLDDGKSTDVKDMTRRINYQLKYMGRRANLKYVARDKVKGVPHHAKAGNINSCLLTASSPDTDYILVLDCDMIIHPSFLRRALGHFLVQNKGDEWVMKDFAGLLQLPQDFWNVSNDDPMVHCARFFYGPMLQGRDGVGCCPCCGTGVIFKRSILVSIGGQAFGSITEDCNTAMCLLAAGFANMFLVERLVYGMAPEDIAGVFQQRTRWAVGAMQILYRDNPLRKAGLTMAQSFLFFEIGAHHYLAIGTVFLAIVPLLYPYLEISPVTVGNLWEFCIAFGVFFSINRLMMWQAHKACSAGGDLELWRGGQMWVWMAPNHIKSIIKTFIGEVNLFRFLKFEISFVVTKKDSDSTKSSLSETLACTWPFIAYYAATLGSTVFVIVRSATGLYSLWEIIMLVTSLLWSFFICLCLWPPLSTLMPRVETEQGWKIAWDANIDRKKFGVDEKNRVVRHRKSSIAEQGSSFIEMEEGKRYKIDKLTENVVSVFRPHDDDDDDDLVSPFEDGDWDDDASDASSERPKRSGIGRMLSSVGRILSDGARKGSESLFQRSYSSTNIGRVALPRKTAETLLQSGLVVSTILPEPEGISRLTSDRPDVRSLSIDHLQSHVDSFGSLVPQWPSLGKGNSTILSEPGIHKMVQEKNSKGQGVPQKDSTILQSHMIDPLGSSMSSRESVVWPTSSHVDIGHLTGSSGRLAEIQEEDDSSGEPTPSNNGGLNTHKQSYVPSGSSHSFQKGTSSSTPNVLQIQTGIHITNSGRVFRGQHEVGLENLTKDVVAHLQLNNHEESSADFVSPFFDDESSNTLSSLHSEIKDQKKLIITDSGKVFRGEEEVGLENLTKDVVAHLQLNNREESSTDFVSPFFDGPSVRSSSLTSSVPHRSEIQPLARPQTKSTGVVSSSAWHHRQKIGNTRQHSLLLSPGLSAKPDTKASNFNRMLSIPVEFDRNEAKKHGLDLIRQMSQALSHEIAAEDQSLLRMQKRNASSVIMSRRATETLGSRLLSQPGSVMLSTIFSQLSQMLPSQLEQKGIIIPVIPENIFEHSIAAKPNFEFRQLPSKTIMFFSINILMITCVCIGGILAIFFANESESSSSSS